MSNPQTKPESENQIRNNAGGYSFEITPKTKLQRFFLLGSQKGTYYSQPRALKREEQGWLEELITSGHAPLVLEQTIHFSVNGRSAKQDQLIFALALVARLAPIETRREAFNALAHVCRIPTTLFQFIEVSQSLVPGSSGWGRMMRKAIETWYTDKKANKLAMAVTKYQNRNGWTHLDVLRKAHVDPTGCTAAQQAVFKYIVKGFEELSKSELAQGEDAELKSVLAFLGAVQAAKASQREEEIIALIREHHLVREHIPNNWFSSADVWRQLLVGMPMTAMIRNLNKLTQVGVLTDGSRDTELVCSKLTDPAALKAALVHPLNLFVALKTYKSGRGDKGSLIWQPVKPITDALEEAFYLAFDQVPATGKRFLLALDVSGSMSSCSIQGLGISCREASAVMSMVTARTEAKSKFMAFCNTFVPLKINRSMNLDHVLQNISGLPFGGTDCSLPITWARDEWQKASTPAEKAAAGIDTFIVYTDNETYAGNVHPHVALEQYRKLTGIPARLIVCGMAVNDFTIADPADRGMLDIAGFDTNAPEIIREFVLGNL